MAKVNIAHVGNVGLPACPNCKSVFVKVTAPGSGTCVRCGTEVKRKF